MHCDDGTLPDDWPVLVFCNLMVEAFAKLGTTSHAAMFGGKYLEEAGFVNIQHRTAKLPYGTWPKDRCVCYITTVVSVITSRCRLSHWAGNRPVRYLSLSASRRYINVSLLGACADRSATSCRTMRLVGLYYRIAAEEFFPAMGAIQMPLLGWTEVRAPSAHVSVSRCRATDVLLPADRDGSVLRPVQGCDARRERARLRPDAFLERTEARERNGHGLKLTKRQRRPIALLSRTWCGRGTALAWEKKASQEVKSSGKPKGRPPQRRACVSRSRTRGWL